MSRFRGFKLFKGFTIGLALFPSVASVIGPQASLLRPGERL
jgi:hypothetical protein